MFESIRKSACSIAAVLAFLGAFPSSAAQPRGSCTDPVGKDFRSVNPDATVAGALVRLIEKLDAERYDIASLLVLRDCGLVFERYNHKIDREYNHTVYSVTKSVSATLMGALLHSGKLKSIDEPISTLLYKPPRLSEEIWSTNSRITPRNVMQMSSGLEYSQNPGSHPIYQLNTDRLEYALNTKAITPPGTKYYYSDGDASVTGAVIAAASGKDLYSTARELLFEPMQMSNHDWWFKDAVGRYPGGWGLRLRPMDMAKLGQLYLQDCVWNGRAICDPAYVKEAWKPGTVGHYGLHWWIGKTNDGTDYFYANGVKGQRIFVVPSRGIVGAMTATLPNNEVRAVDGLLVNAFTGLSPDERDAAEPSALARLAELQKAGFQGKSRASFIERQDYPVRPR